MKPKDELVAIDMETEGIKPVVLHLTANEWVEVLAAVETRASRLERGVDQHDDEVDEEKWAKSLRVLAARLQEQGEQQGIAF